MNILITHPDFQDPGGVSGYYRHLENKFNITIEHLVIGKRPQEKSHLSRIYRMLGDYWRFVKRLKREQYDIVHINPSLDFKSIIRDGIFLLLAKAYRKKIVVFFHGWQESFEVCLERMFLWLFKLLFRRTSVFIVLADKFRKKLKSWGFGQPIYLESTVIDDAALKGFDIHKAITQRQKSEKWRVLFLSRIIREKGIYETIESIFLLQTKYPVLELIIAGEGDELEKVKSFVHERNVPNVSFTGYVRGEDKYQLFTKAHIFCFPTTHGEGMPVTVVEAMAFGLPVITRPVGGIADFFKNGKHGFCTSSKQPEVFAGLIERLFLDNQLYKNISLCNYRYSQSNFLASRAALRLETIYKTVLTNL